MNVCANLFISNEYNVKEIMDGLKVIGAKNSKIEYQINHNYVVIPFAFRGEDNELHIFLNSPELPIPNHMLQLNVRGYYVDILKGLGSYLGGIYQGNDTYNSYQVIHENELLT
jgi:hypothetical protein